MKEISIKRFGCYILYLLSIHVIALFIFFVFRFTLFCSVDYQFPAEIKSDIVLQSVAFLRGLWFDNVVACYILLLPLVILWMLEQQQEWYLVSLHIIFPYSSVFCLL